MKNCYATQIAGFQVSLVIRSPIRWFDLLIALCLPMGIKGKRFNETKQNQFCAVLYAASLFRECRP